MVLFGVRRLAALGALAITLAGLSATAVSADMHGITLQPDSGPPGTTVTVTGRGFLPDEPIQILLGGQPVAHRHTQAAPDGTFTVGFAIPDNAGEGTHEVMARAPSGSPSALFRVQAAPTTTTAPPTATTATTAAATAARAPTTTTARTGTPPPAAGAQTETAAATEAGPAPSADAALPPVSPVPPGQGRLALLLAGEGTAARLRAMGIGDDRLRRLVESRLGGLLDAEEAPLVWRLRTGTGPQPLSWPRRIDLGDGVYLDLVAVGDGDRPAAVPLTPEPGSDVTILVRPAFRVTVEHGRGSGIYPLGAVARLHGDRPAGITGTLGGAGRWRGVDADGREATVTVDRVIAAQWEPDPVPAAIALGAAAVLVLAFVPPPPVLPVFRRFRTKP